ncbi:glutamine synthetase, partial [Candidatus Hakubella thermalkaliphila]
CEPYRALSGMLAAGLAGVENGYELPDPVEKDVYHLSEREKAELGIESLPGSLSEAIELTEQSELVHKTLGDHVFYSLIDSKKIEWDGYRMQVHPYEIEKYLPIL